MNIIPFILLIAAVQAVAIAVQLLFRKKTLRPAIRAVVITAKALLAVLFAVLVLAGPVQLRVIQPIMTAVYAVLLPNAAADALISIVFAVRRKERKSLPAIVCGVIFTAVFCIYGTINMQTVTPNDHTYSSLKLKNEYTVVFLADLHVGSAQPFSVTQKTIEEIAALHPDATILGGDIVDDYTELQEMEQAFQLFSTFDTPVYYIYGNHDRQGYAQYAGGRKFTPEQLESVMAENGVTVLKDRVVQIAPDLALLGREDLSEPQRKTSSDLDIDIPDDCYLLVADHQPNAFSNDLPSGTDLQLSGHTHAGQLFPLGVLYRAIGPCEGDVFADGAVMNVSSGACGWRFPFRTQSRCHYEVITLEPEK